jgi:outer membrane protein TolC
VRENERVAGRLIEAGRATPDVALRARAELQAVAQERLEAIERREAARRAFNVLLDRPLEAPLELVPDSLLAALPMPARDEAVQGALARREELAQLARGRDAARAQERLARASFLPGVSVALDYGVQGTEYRFGADRDFLLATVALQWNLFNGGQDAARREQAALGTRRVETQRRDVERRVALEVTQAWTGAAVAREAIAVAEARLAAAERSFRLVERRYGEGAASLVEFTDARAAYTSAGLNRILTTYEWLARRVDLDRAAALSPLPLATTR